MDATCKARKVKTRQATGAVHDAVTNNQRRTRTHNDGDGVRAPPTARRRRRVHTHGADNKNRHAAHQNKAVHDAGYVREQDGGRHDRLEQEQRLCGMADAPPPPPPLFTLRGHTSEVFGLSFVGVDGCGLASG
jgi:hypothetical protein